MVLSVTPKSLLVFDVGGTNIRGGVWEPGIDRLACSARRPTWNFLNHPSCDAVELVRGTLCEMQEIGRQLCGEVAPAAVVVGWPGPIAPDGHVYRSPTVLGPTLDTALPVGALLERLWPQSPVAILNDLTCAGYAYVGSGERDFCIFTVGSGIANKVFHKARPLLGPGGRGGEVGHLAARLAAPELVAAIGHGIHLGDVASGRGALRLAHRFATLHPEAFARSSLSEYGSNFESERLVRAFIAADPFAARVIGLAAGPLAHAIASVHSLVGSERFFVTGGFATGLGEPYRRLLVEEAQRVVWDLGQNWDAMIRLGDDLDGLVGAGVYGVRELLGTPAMAAA